MSQKSIEINKNNIPDDVKAEAEHCALIHGDSYVIVDKLIDGTIPDGGKRL